MRPPHHIGAQHKASYTVTVIPELSFHRQTNQVVSSIALILSYPYAFYPTMATTIVEDFATRNSGMYCTLIYIRFAWSNTFIYSLPIRHLSSLTAHVRIQFYAGELENTIYYSWNMGALIIQTLPRGESVVSRYTIGKIRLGGRRYADGEEMGAIGLVVLLLHNIWRKVKGHMYSSYSAIFLHNLR